MAKVEAFLPGMSEVRDEIGKSERNYMNTLPQSEETVATNGALTSVDRCDSCGARAYVRVKLATGELLFCAHHAHEVESKLKPKALEWVDESAELIKK